MKRSVLTWALGTWLVLFLVSQLLLVYQNVASDGRRAITGNHNTIIVITVRPDEDG